VIRAAIVLIWYVIVAGAVLAAVALCEAAERNGLASKDGE
jgi:hypothetical protein